MKRNFMLSLVAGLSDIWSLRNRGQRDADRHTERLRKAAKENLREIIAQEDIISTDNTGKKIKIPIRSLEQWRFKHGRNKKNHGVGQGGDDLNAGDVIYSEKEESNKAGDKKGQIIYEEFELEEVIKMMMEDLGLPWLEEKQDKTEIETDTIVFNDISKKGSMSNIDIRKTIKENLKRNALLSKKAIVKNFKQDDLRYKTYDTNKEYHSNASIFLIMDRSGSMTSEKKYIAKSFFFWMVQFIRQKYKKVELIFIAHDTEAHICEEKDFFNIVENGGTKCSSGLSLALEHIQLHYPKDLWNNYVIAISDGDNWEEDNKKCLELAKELLSCVNAFGYIEIQLNNLASFYANTSERELSTLQSIYNTSLVANNFVSSSISKKDDIYDCLKKFFGLNNTNVNKKP